MLSAWRRHKWAWSRHTHPRRRHAGEGGSPARAGQHRRWQSLQPERLVTPKRNPLKKKAGPSRLGHHSTDGHWRRLCAQAKKRNEAASRRTRMSGHPPLMMKQAIARTVALRNARKGWRYGKSKTASSANGHILWLKLEIRGHIRQHIVELRQV